MQNVEKVALLPPAHLVVLFSFTTSIFLIIMNYAKFFHFVSICAMFQPYSPLVLIKWCSNGNLSPLAAFAPSKDTAHLSNALQEDLFGSRF